MEKYTVFMDWKNQHCQNGHTTQSNLQIQCNPYQATNGIFHRTRTNNFTICMEIQKTSNNQSNLEKEELNNLLMGLPLQRVSTLSCYSSPPAICSRSPTHKQNNFSSRSAFAHSLRLSLEVCSPESANRHVIFGSHRILIFVNCCQHLKVINFTIKF